MCLIPDNYLFAFFAGKGTTKICIFKMFGPFGSRRKASVWSGRIGK
jgi:hypothetical protein